MTLVRKVKGIFNGYVHGIVASIEDPEESMKDAIRQTDKHRIKARSHLERVKRSGKSLESALMEASESISTWHERAKKYKSRSETEKAMQCLARKKTAEAQVESLTRQIKEQQEIAVRLDKQIRVIEQRREDLDGRLRVYSTRRQACLAAKATSEGLAIVESLPSEELFQRFEDQLNEFEIEVGHLESTETLFEKEVCLEEENEELRKEFDAL
jgi:phage shock protein A